MSRETKSTRDQQEGKSNLPRLNGLRGKRPGLFVVRNAAFCLKHHGTREDVCRASIRFSPSYDAALLVDSFINTSILRYNNILSCVVYGKMNEQIERLLLSASNLESIFAFFSVPNYITNVTF